MTNNIEKMYELAKVKKIGKKLTCSLLDFGACKNINCSFCDKAQDKNYPPFTDTKQLELIKWIFFNKHKQYLHFFDVFLSYCHGLKFETKEEKRKFVDSEYPQRLAKLVCELWEDLTDEQKAEIKRILE